MTCEAQEEWIARSRQLWRGRCRLAHWATGTPCWTRMSVILVDENKAVIRHYVEQLNERNFAILDELVAEDVVIGSLLREESQPVTGRDRYRQGIVDRIRAFPDYRVTILEMIAEGDQVVVYWQNRGTHQGDFRGVPPTGKVITEVAISIYQLRNGQIVEVRGMSDRADTWQQLGLMQEQ
jgi:steroid delta-isomerase-like uncharacterized protein